MYESITSLFATSNNDLNAFLFLLSLSFALGMLLWAIFIHYPQHGKLHKKHKEVLLNNQKLQKEARITNERFTVVNAKYDHLTNELQNLEARLKAKIQKNTEQEDTIVMITGQLELYKDHARNFKESKEKLTQEFQRLLAENKKLNIKSDELSQIVSLSKQDKDTLQKEYNDRSKQFDKSEAQHNHAHLATEIDSVSYAVGMNIANSLKSGGIDTLNFVVFTEAVKDILIHNHANMD